MKTTMNWTRILRTMVALLVIMSMLLCGCASAGNDDDEGEGGKDNGSSNSGLLKGDGDGKLEPEDVVDNVTGIYGGLLDLVGGDRNAMTTGGYSMDMTITLGDEMMDSLAAMLEYQGLDVDLSWFKSLGFAVTSIYQETLAQATTEVKLNGTSLLTMEVITDMLNSSAFIRVPDLNDEYIGGELDMGMDMEDFLETYEQVLEAMEEMGDAAKDLPTEQELNALLDRYIEAVKEAIGKPESDKDTLSHGGVSMEVEATTYTITTTTTVDIVEALLTTAKDDADLEKVLDAFGEFMNELMANQYAGSGDWEDVDLYEELMELVEQGLESVEEAREDMSSGDWEEQDILSFTNYIADDKQVGFALAIEHSYATELIYFYNLEEDGDTAFVFNAAEMFVIEGTGTVDGDKASGEYTIGARGMEFFYLEIEDFDTKALKKGDLVGTVRLRVGDDFGNSQLPAYMVLELVLNLTDKKTELDINLCSDSTKMFGVNVTVKTGVSGNISVPSDFIDANEYTAMEQWLSGASFDKLLRNLRSAGVDSELVDMLEQAIEMGMGGGQSAAPAPDYGY